MPVRPRVAADRHAVRGPLPPAPRREPVLDIDADKSANEPRPTPERSTGTPPPSCADAVAAARTAFLAGHDDELRDTLAGLEGRYPESPDVVKLRAEWHAFQDDYPAALACARLARLLDPPASRAAAMTVRYSYHALDQAAADAHAVATVRRFPWSSRVLWAAARGSVSAPQYRRLENAWREAAAERDDPVDLLRAVRQLATAAARSDLVEHGIELFVEAIELLDQGVAAPPLEPTRLAGRGAWNAIRDICALLDGARIPFFFAAGTALGFERAGGPLADDGDIDVGILDEHYDPRQLSALIAAHPRFVSQAHPLSDKVHIKHRGGSPVDIFRYYRAEGRLWHDGVFVKWWNTPFEVERRRFDDLDVPLPTHPDRYLSENYADWRTPNPRFDSFSDEAPNCTVHWPAYQRMHFMRRAYQAMSNGDRAATAVELRRAGQPELAERIGAAA
jgi:hypothetical protein